MKKFCLFGGTFDPPHIGHLLVAQTVAEVEYFEKIIFVLANQTPFKDNISKVEHRLSMLKMAVSGNPKFDISEIDLERGGISYTIDTIKEYKKTDFHKWEHAEEILKECQVLVAIRPGFRPSSIPSWVLKQIQFANIPRFEISSTTIRKRWGEDKTIRYMVTQPVWEFINAHNLYSE